MNQSCVCARAPCDYLWFWKLASWAACRWRPGRGRGSWRWLLVQSQTESDIPPGAPCLQPVGCSWSERWAPPYHPHCYLSKASRGLIGACWLCVSLFTASWTLVVCVCVWHTISKGVCKLEKDLYWLSDGQRERTVKPDVHILQQVKVLWTLCSFLAVNELPVPSSSC